MATLAFVTGAAFYWKEPTAAVLFDASVAATPRTTGSTPRAVPVEVTAAREVTRSSDIAAIGTLQSDESVQLAPEIAGRIAEIHFREGQTVKAGDVLVRLDDKLNRASEREMQVRLDLARANLERAETLVRNGTGTTRDLDAAIAERNTAQVLLDVQRVQLSKHDILAPFDGVIGLRSASVGSYVAIGTTLVNLEKIDALKVDFKVPEIHLQQLGIGQMVEISLDAFPGKRVNATVYALDPKIDVNGRAVSARARLENPDLLLRPGLFARILVKGRAEQKVTVVPEAAVQARGDDRLVWVVRDGKAVATPVELGARSRGEVELEGIEAGTMIVTAGHARLHDGVAVDIVLSDTAQVATGR